MPRLHPVPDRPERACLYARVSEVGARGDDLISPEVQETAGRDHSAAQGLTVEHTITDLDKTGRNFKRRIAEAIEGVEQGLWDVIVVYRYDRFGRNARDSLVNIARVEKAGGRVVSTTEPFDPETAVGRYGRTNLLAVAELQSDIIGDNWKAAHERRKSKGLPHAGSRRLGYRYVQKTYVSDEEWAPVVVELYRRYLAGQGLRVLADWLNRLGAPTKNRGTRWSHGGVSTFLDNGFAAGLLHYTSTGTWEPGSHEPLIDADTWQAFRDERQRRATEPRRHLQPATPFSGVVRCDGCKRAMRSQSDRRYGPAYTFTCSYRDCPAPAGCKRTTVETAVLAFLRDYDAEVTTRARARDLTADLRVGARAERRQLERQVAQVDKALVRLTKDRASKLVPELAYAAARDEFLADREQASQRLDLLAEDSHRKAPTRAVVRGLLADWEILGVRHRRDLLRAMLTVWVARGAPKHPVVRVVPVWEEE